MYGSSESRVELENGIRGQVRFIGEPDQLSSVSDKLTEYSIPALSLAVINQGTIEWTGTYQNPAFPAGHPLDCNSIFQAASLSKPVTFLAAVRMKAAGEIDLDADIQSYLTSFALPEGKQTPENPVTFRNVFSHTSGITAGGYDGYERGLSFPADTAILNGSTGVNSPKIEIINPPNESLAYSGGGYTLAEVALQDKFSEEFSAIMKKWILEPAGMNHSTFAQPLPDSLADRAAKGYAQSGVLVDGGWHNYPEQAAAGLWSNAEDMAKFLIQIYNAYHNKPSIFSPEDIRSIIDDERDGHVYGFIISRSDDDISITHYGGNAGYRTGMTISLTSGKGLVYLTNSDNGGALGNELLLSASDIYDWKHFTRSEAKRNEVSAEILEDLPGEYKWNNQIDLSVTYDGAGISLFFPNGDEYKLVPVEGDELDFIHPTTGVRVSFVKEDDFRTFRLYGQEAVKM